MSKIIQDGQVFEQGLGHKDHATWISHISRKVIRFERRTLYAINSDDEIVITENIDEKDHELYANDQ